ncbi:hypothetical protein CAPTEDRAFT_186223 [Capitella teleta]|uniref:Uncharacterized protein n=1 Tax=Capitella teleta TaxID=283909 RepID=R7TY38_CAPTE|nr:hypothetical protein CAPTEDRAFT_186223 [Capitella teleta]|eukprot:ELT98669.1 hypothetical protein CAPTEDRAFT_186223 [Capitella teleta]
MGKCEESVKGLREEEGLEGRDSGLEDGLPHNPTEECRGGGLELPPRPRQDPIEVPLKRPRSTMQPPPEATSQPTACTSSWTRSTSYKRMKPDSAFALEAKVPLCTLCGHSTQGHKKHKKKTFCPVRQESSSKGWIGQKFNSFNVLKQLWTKKN